MTLNTTILKQCLSLQEEEERYYIDPNGEIIKYYAQASHLLLTYSQYAKMLRDVGIQAETCQLMVDLYGLILIFTEYPIEFPKVLAINLES